jgi:P-type Cu2+ transporter
LHPEHAGHGDHGDHAAQFRNRFWLTVVLTVPVVIWNPMIQEWFGYAAPQFTGDALIAPVLGSIIFFYGGWPFLTGAVDEIGERQPGMMLLIGMAITVAYAASMATSLGVFDAEVWWELALLIAVMLLGHRVEMRAISQTLGALSALARMMPDEAERVVGDDGSTETVGIDELELGDVVLVRPGGRIPADGEIVEGSADVDESMITGESTPAHRGRGDRVVGGTGSLTRACGSPWTPWATTPRSPVSSGWSKRRSSRRRERSDSRIGRRHCSSTSPSSRQRSLQSRGG